MNSLHPIEPKNYKRKNGCHLCNSLRNYLVLCSTSSLLDLYFFPKTSGMVFVKGYSLNSYKVAFNRMGSAIFNTIRIPLIALVLVVPIRNIYLLPSR